MRQGVVRVVLLPVVILAGLAGGSLEAATSCVLPEAAPHTLFWSSTAGTAVCSDRMFNLFVFPFGTAAKKSQLVAVVGCAIQIYNIDSTSPQTGVRYSPWNNSWGSNYDHNTHRLRHVALLEGFPYGMASFSSEGWALFKWTTDTSGNVTGFQNTDHYKLPGTPTMDGDWIYGSKMWWGLDGHAYIVARYLDKVSTDSAWKIADMGTGSGTPPLTIKAPLPEKSASSLFDVVRVGNQVFLLQWGMKGLHVFDVSDPSSPTWVGKTEQPYVNPMGNTDIGPKWVWGPAVVNKGTSGNPSWRGYVVSSGGTKLYIVDLNNPASPVMLDEMAVPTGSGLGGAVQAIDSDGKMVAVHQDAATTGPLGTPRSRYYAVDDDSFEEIPSSVLWYDDPLDLIDIKDDVPQDVALRPGTTEYLAFRSN
ncbi:MAG: hypothetical protein MUF10_12875, partial [Thermoanaerobaculaceae bacterium]|nr:hypothetical protein [Thermoanaerobaculaceae bacterium]